MRKIFTIVLVPIFVLFFYQVARGQESLPFVENFGYSTGDLVTVSSGVWTEPTSTTSVPVQVTSGNLSYTDYPSSGVGNKIQLSGGASRERVRVAFTEQSVTGDAAFVSFLLRLTDDSNLDAAGDYFVSLTQNSSTSKKSELYIKPGSLAGKFRLGLAKATTENWLSTDFDVGVTYLIVISYEFLSGDDKASLWVNPTLGTSMPSPDIEQTSGADASDIGGLRFEQNTNTPNAEIDGVRISTSWDNGGLPIELSYFSAYSTENTGSFKMANCN